MSGDEGAGSRGLQDATRAVHSRLLSLVSAALCLLLMLRCPSWLNRGPLAPSSAGDLVTFPAGMSCTWDVSEAYLKEGCCQLRSKTCPHTACKPAAWGPVRSAAMRLRPLAACAAASGL